MVNRGRSLHWVLLILLSLQLVRPPAVQAQLTVEKERELGETFFQIVQRTYPIISDPFIKDYVTSVGTRLIKVVGSQPFDYRFNVIQEETYNAFAGPGGYVFINSGLMVAMESEDELAGILAHEIAHVESRHIAERIARESRIGLATVAGIIAGLFLGAAGGGSADLGSAVTVGAMAAGQTVSLAYSRSNESEADDKGIKWMIAAGYSPLGLRTVLERIRGKQWIGSDQFPTYMSTHPGTDERIAYVDSWLHQRAAPPLTKSEAFSLAKVRLMALYTDLDTAEKYFKGKFGTDADGAMAHFGYGLVMVRKGDYPAALEHLRAGLRWRPLDPYLLADIGKTHFLTGDYDRAAQVLATVIQARKDHSEAYFYYGRSSMALGRYDDAVTAFLQLLEINPRYPQAHRFLGEAYNHLNRPALAHYQLALHYRDTGDRANAIYHFEQALKQNPDPKDAERIRAELTTLKKKSGQ